MVDGSCLNPVAYSCGMQAPEVLANGFLRTAKPPLGEGPEVDDAMLAARGAKPYCEKVSRRAACRTLHGG